MHAESRRQIFSPSFQILHRPLSDLEPLRNPHPLADHSCEERISKWRAVDEIHWSCHHTSWRILALLTFDSLFKACLEFFLKEKTNHTMFNPFTWQCCSNLIEQKKKRLIYYNSNSGSSSDCKVYINVFILILYLWLLTWQPLFGRSLQCELFVTVRSKRRMRCIKYVNNAVRLQTWESLQEGGLQQAAFILSN